MDDLAQIKEIVGTFVRNQERYNPRFPNGCCNNASDQLLSILKRRWIETEKAFSYVNEWAYHTFLRTPDWTIIDPTFWQYISWKKWFVWKSFPIQALNENLTTDWDEHMQRQLDRVNEQTKRA